MSNPIEAIAESLETLAAGIGAIEGEQVEILSHMADAAQAADEGAKQLTQINDALRAITNELMHLRSDLNRFIDSVPRQNSDIRRRLGALETKVG